jgi:GAF domain/Sel1 repeat
VSHTDLEAKPPATCQITPDASSEVASSSWADQRSESIVHSSLSEELTRFVTQAIYATGAEGAAVALITGPDIVCWASEGELAPPVGSRQDTNSGFSGASLRAGRLLQCDSAITDSRVNREICLVRNIHSILAAPILIKGTPAGLLEVFSSRPYAFGEPGCLALQELADSISNCTLPHGLASVPARDPSANASSQPSLSALGMFEPTNVAHNASRNGCLLRRSIAALLLLGLAFAMSKITHNSQVADGGQNLHLASATDASAMPGIPLPGHESLISLTKQAEAGDADAEFVLGAKYASGDEVARNYTEAVKWFNRAVEQGDPFSAAILGGFYSTGTGVPQDEVSAYMWLTIARERGDKSSSDGLALLSSRMRPTQVAEARQRAADWIRLHPTARNTPIYAEVKQ